MTRVGHLPVLAGEAVQFLDPGRGGWLIDATVGLGGHAERMLETDKRVRLLGIDRDPRALERTRRRLAGFGSRVRLVEGCFSALAEIVEAAGIGPVAGVLADLGVSSMQLDSAERGFSFRFDGPLDMRMGSDERTAADVVNRYSEDELKRIFSELGEERQAGRIASAITAARRERPVETTGQLRELIYRAKGRGAAGRREGRVDPATRVFQALRIEVNRELDELDEMLERAVRVLDLDGRLVVISYHSLEDRIVKNTLRSLARGKVDEVTGRPHAETRLIEVLTRKPVRPSDEEIGLNPRARSARLRAARRI